MPEEEDDPVRAARYRLTEAERALRLTEEYHQDYLDRPGWTHTESSDRDWERRLTRGRDEIEAAQAAVAAAQTAATPPQDDFPF